jgi:hypothetical protein
MKRRLIAAVALVLIATSSMSSAYLLTEDIPNLLQNILNYIKQGLQYASQLETQFASQTTALNSITQIEQQLLQLERMGDPKAFVNLPGVQQIALLGQIYQQAEIDVAHLSSLANPASVTVTYNQILQQYGQTAFSGFTSGKGIKFGVPTGLIQFQQSAFDVANAAQQTISTLNQQKLTLTKQRDSAIASESAATDTETRTRYHNQVVSLSASIADINASIQQAIQSQNLQQEQIRAAQGLYGMSQSMQQGAAFQAGMENVVSGGVTTTNASEFGSVDNPATGGNGDPGLTSGSWDVGAWGAAIGNPNTQGVALPSSVLISQFGSTAAAQGQYVQITNPATGATSVQPIVDIGPGNGSQQAGYGIDLLPATAARIGVSSGGQVSYTFVSGLPGGSIATTIGAN